MFSLEERRLRSDLVAVYSFLKTGAEGEALIFFLVTSNRTQGTGMELRQGRFRLGGRKRFFSERVVGHWKRLPGELVTAPSLLEFKKHSDNALRLSIWFDI